MVDTYAVEGFDVTLGTSPFVHLPISSPRRYSVYILMSRAPFKPAETADLEAAVSTYCGAKGCRARLMGR
jgi:hypothetical protein